MLIPSLQDYLPSTHHNVHGVGLNDGLVLAPTTFLAAQEQHNIGADHMLTIITPPSIFDNLLSTFDASQHPASTILASYCLVTAADMVPFVPCQPLAVALGAKLGFGLAFPITAIGQTTAGVLAFAAARKASNSPMAEQAMISANLSLEAMQKLQDFQQITATEEQGDVKILLALIGLRLAPFFPFSAGNYLLGGTTSVPLRLFVAATLFGCLLSNFILVSLGAAGGAVFFSG